MNSRPLRPKSCHGALYHWRLVLRDGSKLFSTSAWMLPSKKYCTTALMYGPRLGLRIECRPWRRVCGRRGWVSLIEVKDVPRPSWRRLHERITERPGSEITRLRLLKTRGAGSTYRRKENAYEDDSRRHPQRHVASAVLDGTGGILPSWTVGVNSYCMSLGISGPSDYPLSVFV
jgi:hypothetical protein